MLPLHYADIWVALHGFEPQLIGSEPNVLPLDERAANGWGRWIRTTVDGTKDRRPTARRFPNKLVDLYGLEPQLAGSEPDVLPLDERSI